jgi:hypothetical protein
MNTQYTVWAGEREREKENVGGMVLKVPRQCPLVLLVY